MTSCTADTSAARLSRDCGVPTQTKWTSASSAASCRSVVNQAAGDDVPGDEVVQLRLGEKGTTPRERRDLVGVVVDGQDLEAEPAMQAAWVALQPVPMALIRAHVAMGPASADRPAASRRMSGGRRVYNRLKRCPQAEGEQVTAA